MVSCDICSKKHICFGSIILRYGLSKLNVDWTNYTQTNDYSFDATKTSYADWTKVTLYRNGVLVWGVEP